MNKAALLYDAIKEHLHSRGWHTDVNVMLSGSERVLNCYRDADHKVEWKQNSPARCIVGVNHDKFQFRLQPTVFDPHDPDSIERMGNMIAEMFEKSTWKEQCQKASDYYY